MAHIFEVGTRAWQPDATEGWIASEVEEKIVNGDKVKLIFRLANGEVCPRGLPFPMQQPSGVC
jgi:myosin-5